ncbi:HNH endonuclease signature motif containing protein [Subtercola endophyticus]|uniref:HNH endonuclease signature motif containing protein n=1 Tax=Subtercola endophyticus TaxID=2895559 RepID=UPI001E4F6C61|nr:HNH endonuclease signature motif containing protein [Subtercola endophyticus]UFS57881.1 HNH endonuclease [Subtercola endophyticus]
MSESALDSCDRTVAPFMECVARAVAAICESGAFEAAAPCGLSDDALMAGLVAAEQLGRLGDWARVQMAGEVGHRSRRELGPEGLAASKNFSNAAELIASAASVFASTARARVRLGEEVRQSEFFSSPLPARFAEVRDALASGEIGIDTADAIIKPLAQAGVRYGDEELHSAERRLVEQATQGAGGCSFTPDQMRTLAIRAREHLDADGAEPRYRELENERGLKLVKMRSGSTRIIGVLTPMQAGVWQAVCLSIQSPRVRRDLFGRSVGDPENGDGHCGGAEGDSAEGHGDRGGEGSDDLFDEGVDTRTPGQRLVDTLTEVMQRASGLEGMPRINGAKPVVSLRANLDDVVSGRGIGWIDGIEEPVPASVVQQLVCHSDIVTTVFGENGQILHLGKTQRLFTAAQNRALAARDGGCVWKGCQRPPEFCESHHVVEWKDEAHAPGVTDVCNGALLCAFHHRHLHTTDWKLVMIDGVPHVIPPKWVDPDQLPQRCRQTSDRLVKRTPLVFEPRSRARQTRPRFTDAE